MPKATDLITKADQLAALPGDGNRYELAKGVLLMMSPSGWRHGRVVGELHGLLWQHVRANALGTLFGAETGFLLSEDPDTVRAPDLAFIAVENLPDEPPEGAYWPGPPDLAVEVLSPSDRTGDVDAKIRDWLTSGARCVWVVDPDLETVTVYRSATDVVIRTRGQRLEGDDVVADFACAIDDIFGANPGD